MLYLQILSGIVLAWLWISAFKKRKYYSFVVAIGLSLLCSPIFFTYESNLHLLIVGGGSVVAIVGLVLEFLNRDRNRSVF